MDPNKTLRKLRKIATEVQEQEGIVEYDQAYALAELVLALDGWITAGGTFPDEWAAQIAPESEEPDETGHQSEPVL